MLVVWWCWWCWWCVGGAGESACLWRACDCGADGPLASLGGPGPYPGRVGGFRLGLEAAGAECVWGCEIDSWARATYAANFGTAPSGEDITRTPGTATSTLLLLLLFF